MNKTPSDETRLKMSESHKGLKEDQKKYIVQILNSNIDFTKRGWVRDVSKLTGKHIGNVTQWMKRYMPDFLKNCYRK